MKFLIGTFVAMLATSPALASCPDYLDQDLRKLHSKDQVNLCEVAQGKPMLIVKLT